MADNPTRREVMGATSVVLAAGALSGFVRGAAAAESGITQLASFRFDTAREQEAFKLLGELAAAVEANEPDVAAYVPHRSALEEDLITFFEIYKDEAAIENHGRQPHLAVLREAFGSGILRPYAEGTFVKIERLEKIGGFIR